ncbi:TPA: hypothetical protein ACH3X3_002601 [Trebouxia sp. C0006]
MIYTPKQPSATAEAGWNDVPLPVMALVLDGIAAKDVWPLRTLGSRWAHAVRAVTACEVSIQAKDHSLKAKLSAIHRRQRNYPLARFVLILSEIMSFSQAARLLVMVKKMGDRLPSVRLVLPVHISNAEAEPQLGLSVEAVAVACTWLQERGGACICVPKMGDSWRPAQKQFGCWHHS